MPPIQTSQIDIQLATSPIDIRLHPGQRWQARVPKRQWVQAISVNVGQTQWIMVYKDPFDFQVFDKDVRSERPGLQPFPKSSLTSSERSLHLVTYLQNALSVAPEATQRLLDALNLGRYVHDDNALALDYFKNKIADWRDEADGTLLHYAAGSGKQVNLVASYCTVSLRDRFGLQPCHVAASVGNLSLSHQLNNTGEPIASDLSDLDVPLQYRKANSTRRALILVNPISGKGFAMRVFQETVAPILDIAGVQYELKTTSYHGEATDVALTFDIAKFDTIMCISGDGILHEVIQGLSRRQAGQGSRSIQRFPIVVIPAGSGNATVWSTSGPGCGPVDVMKKFIRGCYAAADLIEAKPIGNDDPDDNLPKFVIVSFAWGLLSDVDFDSEPMRFLGGLRFTVMAVYRLLFKKKYLCTIRYRNSESEEFSQVNGNLDFFVAANVAYIAPDMKVAPLAKIDDGKIHVCLAQGKSSMGMLSMLACDIETGTHISRTGIVYVSCTEVIIEPISKNSIFDADGERCFFKGAHCFIRPASAALIA